MIITFEPLNESYFPFMLQWLEAPHVKKWWDREIVYTLDLVEEKFRSHIYRFKPVKGANKPILSYIICVDQNPVGYIQIYNAHDFPRSIPLVGLPKNLGGLDVLIGDEAYLGQNIGTQAISKFLSAYGEGYTHIFVDPDLKNAAAIKAYEKVGFEKIFIQQDLDEVWMIKKMKEPASPRVGLGVLIFNAHNQILLGKRKNSHGASTWAPPGGHLEFEETFEECATREVLEETGLRIEELVFVAITNDTFKEDGKHYVSVFMRAELTTDQMIKNLEPHKNEEWRWFSLEDMPEPLFLPLAQLLDGKAYGKYTKTE
jgi:ADP-ribose pyrophosphatase YjhB (NUDIX family)/RimJ/RimL family protein N-acetyltransferase